ncbi:MAG: hypothetical protein ACI4O7_15395, partial [Aristaeellaceae bacterium]
ETVRVRIQKGDSSELKDYPVADVQRPGQPAPAREEPVPAEVPAPEEAPELPPEAEAPAEAPAQPAPQQPRQPRPQRQRGGDQPRQPRERREKPARGDSDRLGKPVQRENPDRKPREEGEGKPERRTGKGENAPRRQQQNRPAQPAADNASPWKMAVERALRAAQGDEADEQIAPPAAEEKPAAPAERDDSEAFAGIVPLDDAEDDTI